MPKSKLIIAGLSSLLAFSAHSGAIYSDDESFDNGWMKVLTLSGGVGWANPGENQTLYLAQGIYNRYIYESSSRTMGVGDLYFALQKPGYYGLWGQWGISIGGSSEARPQGVVNYNDLTDLASFVYRVNHAYIDLRGKLLSDPNWVVQPYLTAAIGVAYNHTYGFNTYPTVNNTISSPWFNTYTSLSFTYIAGAGLQKTINKNWQVGIGYEFSDWGKSGLGLSLEPWNLDGPHLEHIYQNAVLFSVSYIC